MKNKSLTFAAFGNDNYYPVGEVAYFQISINTQLSKQCSYVVFQGSSDANLTPDWAAFIAFGTGEDSGTF